MTDEHKEFAEWLKRATEYSGFKIKESSAFISVLSDESLREPLFALQLGYAVLLDKPIIVFADQAVRIPAPLQRLAKIIERVDFKAEKMDEKATKTLSDYLKSSRNEA